MLALCKAGLFFSTYFYELIIQIKGLFSRLAAVGKESVDAEKEDIINYENADGQVVFFDAMTAAKAAQKSKRKK